MSSDQVAGMLCLSFAFFYLYLWCWSEQVTARNADALCRILGCVHAAQAIAAKGPRGARYPGALDLALSIYFAVLSLAAVWEFGGAS